MYAHIQKLIIKNRVHLQSGFISRIIQRLGINIKEKKWLTIVSRRPAICSWELAWACLPCQVHKQ